MDEKSVDLVDICLRAISAWQYLDTKLTTSKLASIDIKCPYPTNLSMPNNITEDVTKNLFCTKYNVTKDVMNDVNLSAKESRKSISTVKNFFTFSGNEKSFKDKQIIYWRIRLRYACGIVPIAILKMIPDLKKLGYVSWKLPDGRTIPLESIWLGDLVVVPKDLHTVQTNLSIGSQTMHSIIESVEGLGGSSTQGPYVYHSVIVVKENSESESIHILDPTCLQFGMLGMNSRLVMYTSWDNYVKTFPGFILNTELSHQNSEDRLETKWNIGNMGFDHCKSLIKVIIKEIDKKACGHCGEVELNANGNIRLSNCGRCRKVKYCDKLCQKASWKFHSISCSSDGPSKEISMSK